MFIKWQTRYNTPYIYRADSRLVLNQWETSLQSNAISLVGHKPRISPVFIMQLCIDYHSLLNSAERTCTFPPDMWQNYFYMILLLIDIFHIILPTLVWNLVGFWQEMRMQTWVMTYLSHINGLVQERCNSSALALELHFSCINPSTCHICLIAAWFCLTKWDS